MPDATLTFIDKPIPSPLFKRELLIAEDDPLGARMVNIWRMNGTLPDDLPIRTSNIIPAGYGFFAFGNGTGHILVFEPEGAPAASIEAVEEPR